VAKQKDYFQGVNPAQGTDINPSAAEPEETYAYSLEEVNAILAHIPEPAATAFAVAAYAGLRIGEIEGLRWKIIETARYTFPVRSGMDVCRVSRNDVTRTTQRHARAVLQFRSFVSLATA
jgi:integrase